MAQNDLALDGSDLLLYDRLQVSALKSRASQAKLLQVQYKSRFFSLVKKVGWVTCIEYQEVNYGTLAGWPLFFP